jgi:hypothetical protein
MEAAGELSAALTASGVRHCFIKGGGLLGRVYTPGDRELLDLDVLLHPDDVPRAMDVIAGLGYARVDAMRQGAAAGMQRGDDFERPAGDGRAAVRLDVQWAVAPVTRLLSCADAAPLLRLWPSLDHHGPVPTPQPAHHLALVIHHLAHHDLLHVRGLLDAALLWERLDAPGREELDVTARALRVRRLTRALGTMFAEHVAMTPLASGPPRGPRARVLRRLLEPVRWVAWAVDSEERTHLEITPARIGRRLAVVDRLRDVVGLARDVVFPPRAYLRWRWPHARTALGAWSIHVARVVRKAGMRDLPT